MVALAIIVPVLNDANALCALLRALQPWRDRCELIVVDGRSADDSVTVARRYADQVLHSPPGRARQMQQGAAAARAARLWFLHADSQVSPAVIDALLATPDTVLWGRCDVTLDDARWPYRCIGFCMNLRSRLTGICTGDQGIFVRADIFQKLGGYASIPLMEDVELSGRLRRLARPLRLTGGLVTSARRWRDNGVLRTIFLMWWLRLMFFLGVSPAELHRRYYPSS